MSPRPVVLEPGGGRTVPAGITTVRFLAGTEETKGASSVEELGVPGGFEGPPPHLHNETSHSWYVLEGELSLTIDSTRHILPAGGFAQVPAGTAHTFANLGTQHGRLLQFSTPSGFEKYLQEIADAFPAGSEIDPKIVIEIMARHDTYPAGPPPS